MIDETTAAEAEPTPEPIVVEPGVEPVVEPLPGPVIAPVDELVEEDKTYTQEEMDRITAKVKKNAIYQTNKEHKAYLRGLNQGTPKPKAVVTKAVEPKREDFEDYESYLRAVTKHDASTATTETLVKNQRETDSKTANKATQEKINEFQTKLHEKYPNIEQKLEEVGDLELPEGVGMAIAESEFGPDIVNYLADNIKEGERISTLTPSKALREIGRLEAKFEATPVIKPPSAAPAPIKPIKGASNANPTGEPSTDNPEAWALWRNKKLAAAKH